MSRLGTVQADGSILLHDKNIAYREAMTGKYQRVRQTPRQRVWLAEQGYTTVNSSFISAISQVDNNLFIRFLNGSVYVYYGFANHYDNMFKALSKGQYFNRHIRPTKRYEKIDSMPIPSNLGKEPLELSDEDLFKAIDFDYIKKLSSDLIGAEIYAKQVQIKGVYYTEYLIEHKKDTIKILMPIMALNIDQQSQ